MYSTVTGSSTVSLWLWHCTRAMFTSTRASAVNPWRGIGVIKEGDTCRKGKNHKPANARQTWSSMEHIFRTVRASWSFARALFSTASTTVSCPRTATCSRLRASGGHQMELYHPHSSGSFLNCLLCILDLKEVSIWREDGQRTIVSSTHTARLHVGLLLIVHEA